MTAITETRIDRRRLLEGATALSLAALAAPWAGGPAAAAGCATLRAGITGYSVVNTLDPAKASLIPEFYVIWGLFNALLKFDRSMQLTGDLAESWEAVSPTVWRFTLREGVTFHDSAPLTAEDVRFTLDRVRDPESASPHKAKFEAISEIRVIDARTLEIETAEPFAPLLSYLANARTGSQIVPRHLLEDGDAEAFAARPVGSGAYRFEAYEPNVSVTLAAHPQYFVAGQPTAGRVEMPLIPEETSGVTALLGGAIDLTSTAPFADVPGLMGDPKVKVLKSPGLNTRFIAVNHRTAPFDDVHFRRACSLAFDREAMVQVVLFGEGQAANGLIPAALSWAHSAEPRALVRYDPERAKAELEKSRYGAGTEAVVLTWGAGWWKRFAEVFVAQVNETLGTSLRVEVSEANTVYDRLKKADFQASIWGWLGLIDPDEYVYEVLHSEGWRNFHGYGNAELDALMPVKEPADTSKLLLCPMPGLVVSINVLIIKARRETDQAARGALYRQAEDLMVEDAPILCCFESNVHNLMSKSVEGFVQLPYSAYGGQLAAVTSC